MILQQFHTESPESASYLLVDEATGSAAVVNPQGNVERYIDEAKTRGATIHEVLLTHFDPEFLAGYRALRERVGVTVLKGPRSHPVCESESANENPPLRPLAVEEFQEFRRQGAHVVDCRSASEFAQGHLRGAISLGLDGDFEFWAGALLEQDLPVLLVTDPGTECEAILRLRRVGLDLVAGHLDGGIAVLTHRLDLLETARQCTVQGIQRRLHEAEPPLILDIRRPSEFEAGHVSGAVHIPLSVLWDRAGELPMGRELAIMGSCGYRSSTALSLLMAEGITTACNITGGMDAWRAQGFPMVGAAPSRCCV